LCHTSPESLKILLALKNANQQEQPVLVAPTSFTQVQPDSV
jgi:hypothetical protein